MGHIAKVYIYLVPPFIWTDKPGSGGKDDIELAILLSDVTLQLSAPDKKV